MQKKFILVVNPISGGNDKTEVVEAVSSFALEANIEIIVFETSGNDDDGKKLKDLFKEHLPERIIVAGGDGTIKFVGEALEHENVILGIIPAGSANGLSVDLDFPEDQKELLQIAFYNDYMELDMVCINNKKSLHLSDIGLNAELIRNYENGSIRGKLGYAIQAVNTLTDSEIPFTVKVEANGKTIKCEAKMVVVANSKKYGTGITINPIGIMDDGKFEIIILKSFTIGVLGKIIAGNLPEDEVEVISTEKAVITTDIPVHFQIDGEYCGEETKLDVIMLPRQMKIAVPDTSKR